MNGLGFNGEWIGGVLGGESTAGYFGDPAAESKLFDLASLTKVLVTSTALARDFVESESSWENFLLQKLSDRIPELRGTPFERTTIGECWEHRSGLRAHFFLSENRRSPLAQVQKTVLEKIASESKEITQSTVYSDLNFWLLGIYLERSHGKTLAEIWRATKSFLALPATLLTYGPVPVEQAHPTETRHPAGEVNDDNAFAMGSVAPHAGLFGRAADVWTYLEKISAWHEREPRLKFWLLPRGTGRFWGGWDRPTGSGTTLRELRDEKSFSQAGLGWPDGVLGHLGFTGTALWWHPGSKQAAVLLTNRVYPADAPVSKEFIKSLRSEFFSALWQDKLKSWGAPTTLKLNNGPI